ncbi:MAG TPA: hypothetical protein VF625_09900 [Longimicrobium sp.]|jgi:hypothetical protein
MYRKLSVGLAALVVVGCSGSSEPATREGATTQARPDSASAAAAGHDMHSMGTDSAKGDSAVAHAGMQHDTAPGGQAMNHAGMAGMGATSTAGSGSMKGMAHDATGGTTNHARMQHGSTPSGQTRAGMQHGGATGRGAQGMDHSRMGAGTGSMDHSRMNMGTPSAGASRNTGAHSMAGMDHSRMGPATRSTGQTEGSMDHSRMSGMQRGTARGAPAADHSGMAGMQHGGSTGNRGGQPANAAGMDHASMGHGAAAPPGGTNAGWSRTSAAVPADRATDKLLTLVGELVRDPAVQEEIREDPVLRAAWSDPGVRQVVTKRP